jgi:hypothetical protein
MPTQVNTQDSYRVNEAMSANVRVVVSSNGAISLADNTVKGDGILQRDVTADSWVTAPVRFFSAGSALIPVTGAPGTAGNIAYAAAAGRVAVTGTVVIGRLKSGYTVNGVSVEVVPLI